jgi:tryptophanyl-tRNA synthetase
MTTRVFSGIQPTNALTIGNYLGAIRNWVPFQGQSETLFCIVDLHAITAPYDLQGLAPASLEVAAAYLACGIDPKKSKIFVQSHVPLHSELSWLLGCLTPLGWLNRMTQFKDKAGKHKEMASLGLYAYPVLMAADILAYQATHVPVGEDQKQHLELARDIAGAFNRLVGQDFFPLPEPLIQGPAPRVMSLRDGTSKMSKSDPSDMSRIHLTDSDEDIAQKIRKAKTDTDPLPGAPQGLEGRPEAKNLLTLYAAFTHQSLEKVCQEVEGQMFSQFKPLLADATIAALAPIRQRMIQLLQEPGELKAILKNGADQVTGIAQPIVQEAKALMGFLR